MTVSVSLLLYCNCRLQRCFLLMDMLLNKSARETNLVLILTRFRKKSLLQQKAAVTYCPCRNLYRMNQMDCDNHHIQHLIHVANLHSRFLNWDQMQSELVSQEKSPTISLYNRGKAFEQERSHVRFTSCCSISCLSDKCLTFSRVHVTPHHVTHYSCFMMILLMHIFM